VHILPGCLREKSCDCINARLQTDGERVKYQPPSGCGISPRSLMSSAVRGEEEWSMLAQGDKRTRTWQENRLSGLYKVLSGAKKNMRDLPRGTSARVGDIVVTKFKDAKSPSKLEVLGNTHWHLPSKYVCARSPSASCPMWLIRAMKTEKKLHSPSEEGRETSGNLNDPHVSRHAPSKQYDEHRFQKLTHFPPSSQGRTHRAF
jgi:hypothetical protein